MARVISILLFCFLSVISAHSQGPDALGMAVGNTRWNASLSYGHDFGSAVDDSYSAMLSFEFLKAEKFSLVADARYRLFDSSFSESDISYSHSPQAIGMNGRHNVWQLGLTALLRTRLFDKPFVGVAMVNNDFGAGGYARTSSIVMGMIMLKADRNTQFGLGPLFLINTNGRLPVLLAFMYRHRFNDKWRLNLSGGLFAMEYMPTSKSLLTMGTDIDAKSFYFEPHADGLPDKLRFMSVAFRPMVRYSYNVLKNLTVDVRGGASVTIVDRVTGTKGTKKYLDFDMKRVHPFVRLGASYSF